MYGLPDSTTVNRKIPKKRFYENINISPALKRSFTEEIQAIYWSNKIAPPLVNIQEGSAVKELEVFTIELNTQLLNEAVLRQIDREIPYHILFILKFEGKCQAWIAYKEASGNNQTAFRVENYYHSEWQDEDEISIDLSGLSMDAIYENLVRVTAGEAFENLSVNNGESLRATVDCELLVRQLEKQKERLQNQLRREKQLNRKMELNMKLKQIKRDLEELKNGS